MFKILLATKNKHKVREISDILKSRATVVSAFEELNIYDDIKEIGKTFEENACIKALYISKFADDYVIADDSGLEVYALGGRPGVFSARFAGENATDEENNKKLLKELENIDDRKARYVCAIALAKKGKIIEVFTGELKGEIGVNPKGDNGFGYDPIFVLKNGKTAAEISPEEKNKISHRAKALKKMEKYFRDWGDRL
ncbi:XTP/dITP diphosphatase [Deferribacterales bacterium Es71-Z0220]|uniref:XTP/dITP diphosphatase n=1 Tax=Deferrivibrio essentukiensis TaxID=2880922 RepID=UPI001F60B4BE|nr:XTP/dITP diphosphatase [Deferrivibrio essentukiensis]MCB4203443.1 XTP/dITP diphosphatase [Deferrivibrio essentukiensis]